MRATHAGACCKHTLEAVESGWRWTFETAGISVHGDTFSGEAEARADHAAVCQELYDGLNDLDEREDRLKEIVKARAITQVDTRVSGLVNLGNTCYVNSVVQCLWHCAPFRHDLEKQVCI